MNIGKEKKKKVDAMSVVLIKLLYFERYRANAGAAPDPTPVRCRVLNMLLFMDGCGWLYWIVSWLLKVGLNNLKKIKKNAPKKNQTSDAT